METGVRDSKEIGFIDERDAISLIWNVWAKEVK